MYAGLGAALAMAGIVVLRVRPDYAGIGFVAHGIRAAVPTIAFWTVAGLQTALASPVDLRGSWVFRVILGPPGVEQLEGTKMWVTLWGCATSIGAVVMLHAIAPHELYGMHTMAGQVIVAVGVSLLLTDLLFFNRKALPFTARQRTAFTDIPLVFVKYIVLFPELVSIVVGCEPWVEASMGHLVKAASLIVGLHAGMQAMYRRGLQGRSSVNEAEDADLFPQRLGLQE
jgi:hypothetical protein